MSNVGKRILMGTVSVIAVSAVVILIWDFTKTPTSTENISERSLEPKPEMQEQPTRPVVDSPTEVEDEPVLGTPGIPFEERFDPRTYAKDEWWKENEVKRVLADFFAVELPKSARNFHWEGFEMNPVDAQKMFNEIETEINSWDDYKWRRSGIYEWKRGKKPTFLKGFEFGPGTKVITVVPRLPERTRQWLGESMDNKLDKAPGYKIEIDVNTGHCAVHRYSDD